MGSEGRILIAGDKATNLDILRWLLRKNYELETAASGAETMAKIAAFRPQLVLLDTIMPGMDGCEACRRIKTSVIAPLVQVILVSDKGSSAERVRGYDAFADDYLVKPFTHNELLSKVRVHLRLSNAQRQLKVANERLEIHNTSLERLVAERTGELVATQDMAVFALAELADSRDPETGAHLHRIRYYAQTIAEDLTSQGPYRDLVDERFLKDLYRSSPLHDIGKVAVPDCILQKPGRLTPDEFEKIKKHVVVGGQTLERARGFVGEGTFMDMAADIARYHHERFDGTGYCAGLRDDEIPLAAKIVALVDVYDALTSRRVYKPAYDPPFVKEIIVRGSGVQFDPAIVDAFVRRFDDFVRFREGATEDRPGDDEVQVDLRLLAAGQPSP
jgi:response regulator RpfG family c-di-GMP phosphodiesterase